MLGLSEISLFCVSVSEQLKYLFGLFGKGEYLYCANQNAVIMLSRITHYASRTLSLFLLLILGASIAFTSCQKNSFYENEEWTVEGTNDLISDRSNTSGTLERVVPDFSKLRALGNMIEDSVSAEVYLQVIEYYGDVVWKQAHLAGASADTSSYIISVPLVKNDVVTAVILNINENGEQHVLLKDAQILDAPVSELLDNHELWQLKLLASSLSNHQYFYNGEIGFFQDKLQEIHRFTD